MPNATLSAPLLHQDALSRPFVFAAGQAHSGADFLARVYRLADQLPEAPEVINLCRSRLGFMVGFAAAMLRRQTTLLPSNRAPGTIAELGRSSPGSYCLVDHDLSTPSLPQIYIENTAAPTNIGTEIPSLPLSLEVARVYTSGSSGTPLPHAKTWGALVQGAQATDHCFGISSNRDGALLATVPPQHMFGLETSILLPLVTGAAVSTGQPFFPDDIRSALASLPAPRILVSTPLHLQACVDAELDWPAVDFIISATAPLSRDLAMAVERAMATRVLEIYGSTETGAIASRHTGSGEPWRWHRGISVHEHHGRCDVSGGHLPAPLALGDRLDLLDERRFQLLGRSGDMLNIGGKRGSLGDMNVSLNAIPGVSDAVVFVPREQAGQVTRLAALVVLAPGMSACLTRRQLLAELAQHVDPVFLPRHLYFLDRLPRSDTGKLPRERLLELLDSLENRGETRDKIDRNHRQPSATRQHGMIDSTSEFTIRHDHPALAGHFPGHPIVPGVVILDHIITAVNSHQPDSRITSISHAKFHHPLPLDRPCDIELSSRSRNRLGFRCVQAGTLICSGELGVEER